MLVMSWPQVDRGRVGYFYIHDIPHTIRARRPDDDNYFCKKSTNPELINSFFRISSFIRRL